MEIIDDFEFRISSASQMGSFEPISDTSINYLFGSASMAQGKGYTHLFESREREKLLRLGLESEEKFRSWVEKRNNKLKSNVSYRVTTTDSTT